MKITTITIDKPHLEPEEITEVIENLKYSPNLQSVNIMGPAAFSGLPHHSSLHDVKLENLPGNCGDWRWVGNNKGLKEIFVTISGSDESLRIHMEEAHFNGMSTNGTLKIIEHLPKEICRKVKFT